MRRAQRLFFSAMLALMMAMHAAAELLRASPNEASWLSLVGVGVSVLVTAAAVALFLKARAMRSDDLPFLTGDHASRRRSIWLGIAATILCLVGTTLMIVLVRLLGISSAQISPFLDIATAVTFPLLGSIALIGLLRKTPARRADKATSHL